MNFANFETDSHTKTRLNPRIPILCRLGESTKGMKKPHTRPLRHARQHVVQSSPETCLLTGYVLRASSRATLFAEPHLGCFGAAATRHREHRSMSRDGFFSRVRRANTGRPGARATSRAPRRRSTSPGRCTKGVRSPGGCLSASLGDAVGGFRSVSKMPSGVFSRWRVDAVCGSPPRPRRRRARVRCANIDLTHHMN